MRQKQKVMTALTISVLILIGLRMAGYRDYIPSPLVWILIAAQFGLSYFWKPANP